VEKAVGYDSWVRSSRCHASKGSLAIKRCSGTGCGYAVMAAWFSLVTRASRWLRLAGAVMVSLALIDSSAALAAPTWSAPEPVDPAIYAPSVSCASESFCAAVGWASGSGSVAVYSDGNWSEATLIDPDGQLFSVSCPSSSFCMAMDGSGHAFVYDGSGWGAAVSPSTDLTSVSCTSASFCVAVGGSGDAAVYNGSTWSALTHIGNQPSSISCTSESFCMAVEETGGGPGYAVTYNGSTWSSPSEIDKEGNNALHSVSCASSSFCVTVGNSGDELTYNGSGWSAPNRVGNEGTIAKVSCRSESFCVAMSAGGETIKYNGVTWSSAGQVSERSASGGLSCATESFCMAVGDYASTYKGSSWSGPVPVGGGGLSSVSCSSSSFCEAVDGHGRAVRYNGSTWTAPGQIDAEVGLEAVSCPTEAFCMATGGRQHGYALAYNGSAWTAPSEIDPEGNVNAVSCPTASFCVALTERYVEKHELGYALTYKGGAWSAPSEIDTELALRSVSCASENFCIAVGRHDALIYSNGSWGPPQQIYTEGNLWSVSCVSSSFCVAVAEHFGGFGPPTDGEALVYDGSGWSAPTEIPRLPGHGWDDAGTVSCTSVSFCMAIPRFDGAAAIFENGVWGAWDELEINGGFSSVSCPSASFCVVVNGAGQVFTYSSPASPIQQQPGGSNPVTGTPGSAATNSPVKKGKPLVNGKTGEITLEYDFPEPGEVEAYGEVVGKAAVDAKYERTKKCKSRYVRKGKKCVKSAPARYERTRLAIATAGTYKLHIKPSTEVLTALKQGKTLTIRATVVFTPGGTTDHISKMTMVTVHLKKAHQSKHHRV
jgi:hypothetical protein